MNHHNSFEFIYKLEIFVIIFFLCFLFFFFLLFAFRKFHSAQEIESFPLF